MNPCLMFICILVCALACAGNPAPGQLAACPTGVRPTLEPPQLDPNPLGRGAVTRGAELFALECAKCHSRLVAARGSRLFRGYPRLDCPEFFESVTDGYLRAVIAKGGEAVGLDAAMKPFAEKLGSGAVTNLVAYLRHAAR